MKEIPQQQNNGFSAFKFCEKSSSELGCFAFSIQLGLNRKPFAKNLNVKCKQITYHIMQITVNQIMQASLSNFKIITVTNYCEKKTNKGVPPTPPLSKIECIFDKFQVRI